MGKMFRFTKGFFGYAISRESMFRLFTYVQSQHNTKFHHLDPSGSVHNTTRIVRMAPPSPIGGSCCQEIPSWAWHDTRLAGLTRRCSIEDHGMLRWFPCDAGACCADCSSMLGGRHGFKVSCVLGGKMIENGFMDSISSELFSHFDVFVPCPLPSKAQQRGHIGMEGFTTLPVLGIDKPGIVVIQFRHLKNAGAEKTPNIFKQHL